MITTIEYALLAGASYIDTRSITNRFPIPKNWSLDSSVPQNASTGFEASAYKNSLTNEIIISYAGTYNGSLLGQTALGIPIDLYANANLALGDYNAQLTQAVDTTCKSRETSGTDHYYCSIDSCPNLTSQLLKLLG